jgi:Protein kinase domain
MLRATANSVVRGLRRWRTATTTSFRESTWWHSRTVWGALGASAVTLSILHENEACGERSWPASPVGLTRCETLRDKAARLRRKQTILKMEGAAENVKLEERYDVDWDNPLGEGSFGSVYAAVHRRTGDRVAVKKICKTLTDNTTFQREMEALLHIRQSGGHPNICGLRENFDERGFYYLVLDLVAGCEMFDALIREGAYSEADAARLVQETASALDYLHGIQIVHGDLKPENLMLSSQHVSDAVIKVVDFGCAQVSHDENELEAAAEAGRHINDVPPKSTTPKGGSGVARTPAYCPPEVLEARKNPLTCADYRVEPSLDMWVRVSYNGTDELLSWLETSPISFARRLGALL